MGQCWGDRGKDKEFVFVRTTSRNENDKGENFMIGESIGIPIVGVN